MAKQKAKPHLNKSPMFSDAAAGGDEGREQNRSAQARPAENRSAQARPAQARPAENRSSQARPAQDRASSAQDRSSAANAAHESGTLVAERDEAKSSPRAKSGRKQPQRGGETGPRATARRR